MRNPIAITAPNKREQNPENSLGPPLTKTAAGPVDYLPAVRRRTTSKHRTAAALATLSDSTPANIGIDSHPVTCGRTSSEMPLVSLPSTNAARSGRSAV